MELSVPFFALLFDKIIGDPRSSLHPVVIIGNLIAFLENIFLRNADSNFKKFINGMFLVLITLFLTYFSVYLLVQLLSFIPIWLAIAIQSLLLSFVISPRSLSEAANEIKKFLEMDNLHQARYKVGWIVGRDTHNLSRSEISRATVETVAENIVDGIIAPLFYFAIGGLPLAYLYRTVNTLDSMVGYKNDKYLYFGKSAARIDDFFNYIPARITGILIIFSSLVLGLRTKKTLTTIFRDASKHPSPNSGIPEAGVAGALGIRLGGLNYYKGVSSFRAYMGEGETALTPTHIKQTISIMYTVTLLYVIIAPAFTWILKGSETYLR